MNRTNMGFMKLNEAAEYLNVSRSTLYRWIHAGELQTIKYPNTNSRLIPVEEIERVVKEAKENPEPTHVSCDQATSRGTSCQNRPVVGQTVCVSHGARVNG